MDSSAEAITTAVRAMRERAGLSMAAIAKAMGYKNASSYQRYENATLYKGGFLPRDWVDGFGKAVIGKGEPPIRREEVWELAGPEFSPGRPRLVSTFDPDAPEPVVDPDAPLTHGSETGASIPQGTSPQLDVTGGMGAGGFVLTSEGVPGKFGMTFAADHIAGYWQLPDQVLTSLSLRARDTVIIPVQGNSMAPTLIEGDFVFIDTRHRWPSPDGIYALADEFGGIIVKTLRLSDQRGDEGPYIDVVSDNPDRDRYPIKTRPADELRIIGRVVRRFSAVF
jgi:hypothetical protein